MRRNEDVYLYAFVCAFIKGIVKQTLKRNGDTDSMTKTYICAKEFALFHQDAIMYREQCSRVLFDVN